MALTKKSQSMINMFIDDSIDDIDDGFHSAPVTRENRHDVSLQDDDEDDDIQDISSQDDLKFHVSDENIGLNVIDDKKVMIDKEWKHLEDNVAKQESDLVIVKAEDMRFDSASDLFSYTDIGEPQKEQYLTIDFSPEKGVDDDRELLEKCSSFWKFIEQYPELQSLRAEPDNHEDLEV